MSNKQSLFTKNAISLAEEYALRLECLTRSMSKVNELEKICERFGLLASVHPHDTGEISLTGIIVDEDRDAESLLDALRLEGCEIGDRKEEQGRAGYTGYRCNVTAENLQFSLLFYVPKVVS